MKRILFFIPILFLFSSVSIYHPPSNNWTARNKDSVSIYEYGQILSGAPCEILHGLAFAESSCGRNIRHRDPMDIGWFGLHEDKDLRAERLWRYGEYDANNPSQAAVIAGKILMHNYKYFIGERRDAIRMLHAEAMRELDNPMDQAISSYNQGINGYKNRGLNQKYIDTVKAGVVRYVR